MLKIFLVVSFVGAIVVSCGEPPTSVVIRQGKPQHFVVSGHGTLDHFTITGPVARCTEAWKQDRLPATEVYWEIVPLGDVDINRFSEREPIIYGRLPDGFKQVAPKNGEPPPICDGGPYNVTLAIREGGGICMFFAVYGEKIVSEGDAR
jgi:hypothetical protein